MKRQSSIICITALVMSGLTTSTLAMDQDTIYQMPADADFSQYYLANEQQPEKGVISSAEQCQSACETAQSCVVWTFKPGRFGSPASCKLSPKLMQEQGIKAQYAGGASGVIESR